jgi:hypothetical protein
MAASRKGHRTLRHFRSLEGMWRSELALYVGAGLALAVTLGALAAVWITVH